MKIKIISGKPGTGKTKVLSDIYKMNESNSIILCFTHSNVNIFKKDYGIDNVHTIHSYFKANFNNKVKKLPTINYKNILVDEFTMIPFDLLKLILKFSDKHQLILAGDILQLSSINKNEINLNYDFRFDTTDLTPNEIAKIYFKLSTSIYSKGFYNKSDQMILKKNYRSNSKVFNILDNAMDNRIEIIKVNELMKKIKYKNYTVIGSRYKHLKYIYSFIDEKPIDYTITRCGKCNVNQKFIVCENINKNLVNGDIVTIENNYIVKGDYRFKFDKSNKINVLPMNFTTVHKSQGQSYDKVICLLDDLFDISMLYVMITRARFNVKFYICSPNSGKVMGEIKSNNKCLKIIDSIIYNNNN